MAVMPTLAWPGDLPTPHHPLSFIRLDHILNHEIDTPHRDHHQPRHLPHTAVCFEFDSYYNQHAYGDYERYVYVDLHGKTLFVVSSSKAETRPLPKSTSLFWVGVLAEFGGVEDPDHRIIGAYACAPS